MEEKMNKKKIISGVLAGIMLAGALLTSCSKTESEPPKSKRTNVYAGEDIKMPDTLSYVNQMDYRDGKLYMTYYTQYTITRNELGEEVERRVGYFWDDSNYDDTGEETEAEDTEPEATDETEPEETKTDSDSEKYDSSVSNKLPTGWYYEYESVPNLSVVDISTGSSVECTLPDNVSGYSQGIFVGSDGMVNILYNEYQWDEETGNSSNIYTIVKFDPMKNETVEQININDSLNAAGFDSNSFYVNSITCSDSGELYITVDTTVVVLNPDLSYNTKYEIESGWINRTIVSGDTLYLLYYSDNGGQSIKVVENGAVNDIESDVLSGAMNSMYDIVGFSDGKLYYRTATGVSIYDIAADTISETMNFINSDISPNNINMLKLLPDERIIIVNSEYINDNSVVTAQLLSKIPDEELQEEIIVKLGALYSNYNITNAIIRYNKQNTGVRISLVSYEQYNNEDNEYTGAVTQLNNDIITGNLPDIILLNTQLPVESYFQKRIFTDLNEFIDDEELGIDRSNYLSNVFDACSVDGKLYSIIMSFSLRTLIAKSEFVGNEPGWTFDEMMQCINNMPEGMVAFFDNGRDDIIDNFFSNAMSSFVNWDTGETYFESQGFINFIKYLAECPEKGYWERYYESRGDNYVYDEAAENEMWQNYEIRFFSNKALFDFGYISSFTDFLYDRNAFATKDVTAIGYPSNSGNGAIILPNIELAISQKSAVKKQAWDVLKFFLNDEGISNRTYLFSPNITNLKNMASKAQDNYYYYDNSNEDFSYYKENGYSDEYIEYLKNSNQPFDQSVVDNTMNLIENATEVARSDSDLLDIVKEELSSFFGGTKSAEEAAKIIASRAKIYISENS